MNIPVNRREILAVAGTSVVALGTLAVVPGAAGGAPARVTLSDAQWRRRLGAARYHILRQAGTERPYSSPLNKEHRRGTFRCAGCGLPLFASTTKFESGTGWPSFYRALPAALATRSDRTLLMSRTEVLCRRCNGHLGHVFNDGPKPTGLRYCMNGLALTFVPA